MRLQLMLASAVTAFSALLSPVEFDSLRTAANPDGDLSGVYECVGARPDGAAYRGIVHIVRDEGTYQLLWTFGDREQYFGIGIVSGDVLAVGYVTDTPSIVAYRIEQGEKGPRLVGQWTAANAAGHVFGETLTRVTKEVTQPQRRPVEPNRGRVIPFRLRAA